MTVSRQKITTSSTSQTPAVDWRVTTPKMLAERAGRRAVLRFAAALERLAKG